MHDEATLWQRWHEGRDEEARALLLARHLPYARVLAAQCFAGRRHEGVEFEEYLQFAQVALIESLERYDPALGTQFRTFAHRRIAGAIFSGLEGLSERQQQVTMQKRLKASRTAAADAATAVADRPASSLWRHLAELEPGLALAGLLEGAMIQTEDNVELADTAFETAALKQCRHRLQLCLRHLTERESQVIRGHYLHASSFDELAKTLGISNARVTQLHQRGLLRLRMLMARADFEEAQW